MGDYTKELVRLYFKYLKEKGKPLTKIAIQKGVFFLREMGLPYSARFQQYFYGPYSHDLVNVIDELKLWGEIEETNNKKEYKIIELKKENNLPEDLIKKFYEKAKGLECLLDYNFNFKNLELMGTVLFCIRILEENLEEVSLKNVINEVKDWKGDKFTEQDMKKAYAKIKEAADNKYLNITIH
jgi:uncharacterized protein YwgA